MHNFNYHFTTLIFWGILAITGCKKDKVPAVFTATEMLQAVNTIRITGCRCGTDSLPPVSPLNWNNKLAQAAEQHARDMYTNNYFDHISLSGSTPMHRAQAAGFTGSQVGENIAKGYTSLQEAIEAWKKSTEHCKAMMDSSYNEMGAGYFKTFWVQNFGKN